MEEIPMQVQLVQRIFDYVSKGSTPRCTYLEVNQLLEDINAAGKAAEKAAAKKEPRANGAAPKHG